jgi:predicted nucleic acid-binding protein
VSSQVCVDANLVLKLVLVEEDSPLVHELWGRWIDEGVEVVAPPLLSFEGASVIRSKVHRGLVPPDEGELMFEAFQAQGVKLLYPDGLHRTAWELAKRFDRPAAYDSHYLALAEMLGCELWTGDRRLYNVVKDELPWVKWLGGYQRQRP